MKHEVCKIKFCRGNLIKFFQTWYKLSQQKRRQQQQQQNNKRPRHSFSLVFLEQQQQQQKINILTSYRLSHQRHSMLQVTNKVNVRF